MAETALITGASSGIGEQFARQLAERGHDLILVARRKDSLSKLADELSTATQVIAKDLASDAGSLKKDVDKLGLEVDLLVNNAGFGTAGAYARSDVEREEQQILLNVVALARLTRAALGRMSARGEGAIINVSSLAGLGPYPYTATYGATKAFVNSFTEAIAEELRGSGVRVQALLPGFTRTAFQERAGIDPGDVPAFAWMEAEDVVDASLAALGRGEVICVPGLGYRALAGVAGVLPRSLFRRVVGVMQASRHSGK